MDYFAEERTRQAEEIVKYLPDTIYTGASFSAILSKREIAEFRQSFKKQKIQRELVAHKAFKKLLKPGMNALRKALNHVRERGFQVCDGEPGCNACCRRLVLITSKVEVGAIEHMINNMLPREKERLHGSFRRHDKHRESVYMACGVLGDKVPEDAWSHIGGLYPEVGGLCPALSDTGQCLIYAVRPWSCRTYRTIGGKCEPMTRINLARFPDIDATMLNILERHAGKTETTLFSVIRKALKSLSPR